MKNEYYKKVVKYCDTVGIKPPSQNDIEGLLNIVERMEKVGLHLT